MTAKKAWLEEIVPAVVHAPPGVQRLAEVAMRRAAAKPVKELIMHSQDPEGVEDTDPAPEPEPEPELESEDLHRAKEAALHVLRQLRPLGRNKA